MITLTIYGLGSFHDNVDSIIAQISHNEYSLKELELQYFNLLDRDLYDKESITLGTVEFLANQGCIFLDDFIEPIIFKGGKRLCIPSI